MDKRDQSTCTAFEGFRRIASGELAQVALKTKKVIDRGEKGPILIFDDVTGEQIELDFRGTGSDVVNRIAKATSEQLPAAVSVEPAGEVPRGPGRPKLGVVAPRSHFAAAALGLAQRSTRGCVGRAAKACGGGEARQRGPGPRSTVTRVGLPVHVGDGRQSAGIRGGNKGLIRQESRFFRKPDSRLAQGSRNIPCAAGSGDHASPDVWADAEGPNRLKAAMLRLVCGEHGARGRALADACPAARRGGRLLVSTANEMLPPDLGHPVIWAGPVDAHEVQSPRRSAWPASRLGCRWLPCRRGGRVFSCCVSLANLAWRG